MYRLQGTYTKPPYPGGLRQITVGIIDIMVIRMTPLHASICPSILDRCATISSVVHTFRSIQPSITMPVSIPIYSKYFSKMFENLNGQKSIIVREIV